MANPAPTINQINAFNATQGTTIDFNIIGGTELVRSNKIYIYDLSDNSLICTHLYVSTESIHELPTNTDSSIVYESGKSSADFVNGAQYYAQIQTYTDTAGTQGGSGLSVAKMFWCLVDPTLTITTIPSTISTTSYNVSATYTDTSASVVSNIIQQYQFNLYSAVGSLLQSSGVVVGSGTQQGTSDVYDISYNFTGLNVGSSYYVTVKVTTTQGMNVIAQSNTFTVSIDTPTLGEATIVNNACDGYISVTSNLSGEYGGSASGEIASFVTNSVNNISSLKVNLDPIQDLHGYDAPWVGGAGANKWDEEWENGSINNNGQNVAYASNMRSKNYIPILPDTEYGFTPNSSLVFFWYDADKNFISYVSAGNTPKTSPPNARYLRFRTTDGYGGTYNNDIAINYPSTVTTYSPWQNICPISGHDEVDVSVVGKNLVKVSADSLDNSQNSTSVITDSGITVTATGSYGRRMDAFNVVIGQTYTISFKGKSTGNNNAVYFCKSTGGNGWNDRYGLKILTATETEYTYTFTATTSVFAIGFYVTSNASSGEMTITNLQLELGTTATTYEPYNGTTYTTTLPSTTYGGTLDVVSGVLTVTHALVDLGTLDWYYREAFTGFSAPLTPEAKVAFSAICSAYPFVGSYNLTSDKTCGYIYEKQIFVKDYDYTDAATFKTAMNGVQLCYELATPTTTTLTPQQIQTLNGQNNVWSEQGNIELAYHIPITNLLVKRQDVDDVSGNWLTLYSQPITQASDMDFTFIDFTNQYGKTYKYALVPLLTQQQSGVEVEVEGGYTVSDKVQSIFDGVFIADSTGLQKCKANVGYGNVDMNQVVGSITPIGAKYPIVITNSQNQYHNGSISGTIVPDDYYFNGNLSRIDMVNKRDELEQFLTNKRAKIIKDWNGNIWLVMIMDNVSCTFNNNYGMGIVNFSTNWVEVGDPTNQQDLQATGLINVGGV